MFPRSTLGTAEHAIVAEGVLAGGDDAVNAGVGVREWRPRPTLRGADYASQAVYEEERERLFYRGWFCIGRAEEVPAGLAVWSAPWNAPAERPPR